MVLGVTRSGKSTLAQHIFLSAAPPRLVIDPNDTELTDVAGAVTFRDPRAIPADPEIDTLRFVPRDPTDRAGYDAVYEWAFEHFPRYVWADEPEQALPVHGFPRNANVYVAQGGKRGLGHLVCSTRPKWLMKSLFANVQHLVLFDLPSIDDRRYVADNVGIPLPKLEAARIEAQQLKVTGADGNPKGGFLWWNQLTRELTICPPLTLR